MRGTKRFFPFVLTLAILVFIPSAAQADDVTEWNQHMLRAGLVDATPAVVMTRVSAIVQASVFDAVNGIDRRYTPINKDLPAAPAGASRRAAVVQAAYTALLSLYPKQKSIFDARLAVSLAAIASDPHETSDGIAKGITWGMTAANGIIALRSTDGFTATSTPPNFQGPNPPELGKWRPTPPAFAFGIHPELATSTPWFLSTPSQFRPAGPPSLTSARYATDFNETKVIGRSNSAFRTLDQTLYAWWWQIGTATYIWNHLADVLIERRARGDDDDDSGRSGEHRHSLLESARILALLDLAMADGAIACWDAKYFYVAWRPVTAIPLEASIGNPGITHSDSDDSWMPLFATPAHPEYPSAHSSISGAAVTVLAAVFGDRTHITVDNDLAIGVTRSFGSFSSALDEVKNARVFAGIHFRFSCDDGTALGSDVGNWVLDHALLPAH